MERRRNEIEVGIPTTALPPPWTELPEDVTANILQRLGAEEILRSAQNVCTTWWDVCQDPALWRVVNIKYRFYKEDRELVYELMCRCAVDRSQGQLTDLSLTGFGEEDLLHYVAHRSSNLRRLTLADTCDISGLGLAEVVKKLPQLDELHLIMMPEIFASDVETIGISCPMLKSFSLIDNIYEDHDDEDFCNCYGLSIGKTMPNLRHLRLISDLIKKKGLEAILDGCPHLESLDLRQCFGLDLQGALGKRLFERIKDVRLPSESISDYDWPLTEDDWEEEEESEEESEEEEEEDQESDGSMSTEYVWEESDDTMSNEDDWGEQEQEQEQEQEDDTMSP